MSTQRALKWHALCQLPNRVCVRVWAPPPTTLYPSLTRTFSYRTFASTAKARSKLPEARHELPAVNQTLEERAVESLFSLRPYQTSAIDACVEALARGLRRIGVSSPTGSGKTTIFMKLIPHVIEGSWQLDAREASVGSVTNPTNRSVATLAETKSARRPQTLILVNGIELALQAYVAAGKLLPPGWSVELEQANKKASGTADVTIATFQTLLNPARLAKFDPSRFGLVIVDEAHHSAARSYLQILHYFNAGVDLPTTIEAVTERNHDNRVPIIGFSATFSRHDQMALSAVFEEIVFHRDIRSMLEGGWLSPAKATSVQAELNLGQVEVNESGDFSAPSLAATLDTPSIREIVVRTYLHLAEHRRSTLVFCTNLEHVANLTEAFRDAGVDARWISSKSHPRDRQALVKGFGAGEFPVLVNCEVLTEGTDIPQIDCIMLVRPTKSQNLLIQMVGRGLRLCPETGKEDCHIIDIVDSVSKGLTVSPTLFGLRHEEYKPEEDEEEEIAEDAELKEEEWSDEDLEQLAEPKPPGKRPKYKVTLVDEDDPFNLAGEAIRSIHQVSYNAWVACGPDVYILEMFDGQYVRIAPNEAEAPKFIVKHVSPKVPAWARSRVKIPYKDSKDCGQAETLNRAVQTADAYINKILGRSQVAQFARNAAWRKRKPSEKALNAMLKLKGIKSLVEEEGAKGKDVTVKILGRSVPVKNLNAGQVASLLTAAKHGGRSRAKKEEIKAENQEKRERKREAKEILQEVIEEEKRAKREEQKLEREAEKAADLARRNLPLPPSR